MLAVVRCGGVAEFFVLDKAASSEQWFKDARFKIFCAACWDEAKVVCSGFAKQYPLG